MLETIPYPEYRARPGLSSGFLRNLLRSPLHARYKQDHDEDSAALAFGRYVHAAVLEPETVMQRFVVKPEDMDRRTKAGRAAYEELQATGKQIVTEDEMHRGNAMRAAILKHPSASKFLRGLAPDNVEQSAFWQQGGLDCKARFDHISGEGAVVDLKTTTNANRHEFERSISQYGYHVQGCHYLNGAMACGLKVNQFIIIAVESEAPHGVAVYRLDQGYIDAAQEQIEGAFAVYKQCVKSGNWGGYPNEVQDVLCPAWMSTMEVG